jgi:hypothetical protein
MTASFTILTIIGGVVEVFTLDDSAAAVVPIVVLQAFSAATGFAASARRGYFDLLMACGEPRVRVAIVQWVTAITPGLVSWATLAAVRALAHGATNNPSMASGTALAFVMVSTIPWAVTVSLPRFSGAIGWLLVICLGNEGGVIWPDSVRGVVFPIELVGRAVDTRPDVLVPALLLAALSVASALLWVHRTDIPLESAQ